MSARSRRRDEILELARRQGFVTVEALARRFAVTVLAATLTPPAPYWSTTTASDCEESAPAADMLTSPP